MPPESVVAEPIDPAICSTHELVACHECDALHRRVHLQRGASAHCVRCGAVLFKHLHYGIERPLALALAALGLFLITHAFPFLSLKIEGIFEENVVTSGVLALWNAGMPDLAILVGLTSVLFPLITIIGLLWLLIPLSLGVKAIGAGIVYRTMHAVGPWSLLAVFMLGVLVAFVKLVDLATVVPGVSLFAFAALMIVATAANASFRAEFIWDPDADRQRWPVAVDQLQSGAAAAGLLGCHVCTALTPIAAAQHRHKCHRCGAPLHEFRKTNSLVRCWALVISAVILLFPANLYPVMTVIQLGRGEPSTILSGVAQLLEAGAIGLATVVFVASVVVPVVKIILLIYLLISVQRRSPWRAAERTRLYRLTEVVGAWSMVDIFLVGVLSALVKLQALATIEPGIGASYFGAVVVMTMFAAHSFDPRLIWDHAVRPAQ